MSTECFGEPAVHLRVARPKDRGFRFAAFYHGVLATTLPRIAAESSEACE
jgi:hypothetical protein